MSEDSSELLAKLLRGETEYVVSHPGRSQYSAQGSGASACGLAALNCARLVLQNERNDGAGGEKVLNQILQREFSEVKPPRFYDDSIHSCGLFVGNP